MTKHLGVNMPFIFTGWQVDLVAKVGAATTLAAEMLPGVAWCR